MDKKDCFLDFTLDEAIDALAKLNVPSYVAKQPFNWLYHKHISDFSAMSNISKKNQSILRQRFYISPFGQSSKLSSKDGLASKYIFTLSPKESIESVVLKEKKHTTLCISSQCGCPVNCKFCLTGVAGFKRNLSSGEVIAQLLHVLSEGHAISHIVFMGMGEPLLNYKAVFKAIDLITNPTGFMLSKRKITVSTSGYLATLKKLIEEKRAINLAFSVGHPNPAKREKIMPIEKRNPIMEVATTLKEYLALHNRKLTLEYTLLKGENDTAQEIRDLANLAQYLQAKVNLINLNPHPQIPFLPVSKQTLSWFKNGLIKAGVPTTTRFTKGLDIVAACGQLGESLLST